VVIKLRLIQVEGPCYAGNEHTAIDYTPPATLYAVSRLLIIGSSVTQEEILHNSTQGGEKNISMKNSHLIL